MLGPATRRLQSFTPSSGGDLGGLPRRADSRVIRARPEAELSRFAAGESREQPVGKEPDPMRHTGIALR